MQLTPFLHRVARPRSKPRRSPLRRRERSLNSRSTSFAQGPAQGVTAGSSEHARRAIRPASLQSADNVDLPTLEAAHALTFAANHNNVVRNAYTIGESPV